MKLSFPKSPDVDLSWGMLQNSAEWKSWTKSVLETLVDALESCSEADKEAYLEYTATELFEEISQCGYEEGYDTAEMNNNEL
jgi:hypothetical protein